MKPYNDNLEHLFDELSRIDRLIRNYLEFFQTELPEPVDEFRGLYISEAEIQSLQKFPGFDTGSSTVQDARLEENEATRRKLESIKAETLKKGRELRLHTLSELFGLYPFEIDVLLIGLAPELDLKYEKIYSYLQNDVTKKRPGIDLVLNLLCSTAEEKIKARAYFLQEAPLIKNQLVRLSEQHENTNSSLICSFIKIDERIVNFLLGFDEPDLKIRNFSAVIEPQKAFEALILPENLKNKLVGLTEQYTENQFPPRFLFWGPSGSGKKTAAEAICNQAGINLLVVDSKFLLEENSIEITYLIMREALLQNSALYLCSFDSFLSNKESRNSPEFLIRILKSFPGWVFLAGEEPVEYSEGLVNNGFIPFFFPLPSYSIRKQLWELCLKNYKLADEVDLNALASKFRFSGGQISNAANTAFIYSEKTGLGSPGLSMNDLYKSCKAQSNKKLTFFAKKIDPHYAWDDIILPKDIKEHLRGITGFIKFKGVVYTDWGFDKKLSLGKGLNVLFSGPSGTGKTMAAEIIAKHTELDLYKIDLSCVISKYIGETEKNLSNIFSQAETSNAILFFDEADALFGKRSEVRDSHDRYANIEINYLLQKMEEYEGVVILATNLRQNMDEAFLRRLHMVVEFPFPDEEYRLKIWRSVFPKETPIDSDVDYNILAHEVKLSGGYIKNIALTAAFYAAEEGEAVRMIHLMEAVRREYQKLGRTWNKFYDDKKVFPA